MLGAALGSSNCPDVHLRACPVTRPHHLLASHLPLSVQELRRCLPLMLRTLRALLRFLAAAELSAKLQAEVLAPLAADSGGAVAVLPEPERDRRWRVKCAELLAVVMAELAALKVRRRELHCMGDCYIYCCCYRWCTTHRQLPYGIPAVSRLKSVACSDSLPYAGGGRGPLLPPAAGRLPAAGGSAAQRAQQGAAALCQPRCGAGGQRRRQCCWNRGGCGGCGGRGCPGGGAALSRGGRGAAPWRIRALRRLFRCRGAS